MKNIKQTIDSHNKSTLNNNATQEPSDNNCNCRKDKTCPLDGKCLTPSLIYQATVTRLDTQKTETYIGLTENTFKTRFNGHLCSFRNSSKRNSTTLSQYVWYLKDNNIEFEIKWKIVDRGKPYSPGGKSCNLCIKEKYFIICKSHMATLNSRNELGSECRHRKKHLLANLS